MQIIPFVDRSKVFLLILFSHSMRQHSFGVCMENSADAEEDTDRDPSFLRKFLAKLCIEFFAVSMLHESFQPFSIRPNNRMRIATQHAIHLCYAIFLFFFAYDRRSHILCAVVVITYQYSK